MALKSCGEEYRSVAAGEQYASPPKKLPDISECKFYHSIDLPGLGEQRGQWDLRPGIKDYLGAADFSGKRTLEIGTANGFVCFELERRGADVVAFDLREDLTYDAPPLGDRYLHPEIYRDGLRRIRNAFWLGHALLHSRARVAYGHANKLPSFLGQFDVTVIANVLQHLQDPVGAIMQAASISRSIVITEADWMAGKNDDLPGMIIFDNDNPFTWYQVKPKLIEVVLRRFGFGNFRYTTHDQLFLQDAKHTAEAGPVGGPQIPLTVPHFTVTAELIGPSLRQKAL
jgi:SAM-dependent methyltransferase